jgi:hypothetical protein
MLSATEFEQLLKDLEQLSSQENADGQLAKTVYDNLSEIKRIILLPKTPENKKRLLELIAIGEKMVGRK